MRTLCSINLCFSLQKYAADLKESDERILQIQQLGKSSLAIAQKGFEDKLKSLRKLASEQEAALTEDERTIDTLRLQIAQLQRAGGVSAPAADTEADEAARGVFEDRQFTESCSDFV